MKVKFKLIRLLGDHLVPSNCELTVKLHIPAKNKVESTNRITAMRYWIENFVDGCIAYPISTELDTELLCDVHNHIMMVPEEPLDYVINILIHQKLTAMGGEFVDVKETTFESDSGYGFSNTISGTVVDILPTMGEWMGVPHYNMEPWWNRDDSSMVDMRNDDGDDVNNIPELGINILKMLDNKSSEDDVETKISDTVVRGQFRPKVIEGGKSDNTIQ
jgi:hypothetical protein